MTATATREIHVASLCYGGLASAGHLRSLLALRVAAVREDLGLRLDLGGGEALVSRGRAGALGRFIAGGGSWLLLTEGDVSLDEAAVLRAARSDAPFTRLGAKAVLLSRRAAEDIAEAGRDRAARLGDVFGPDVPQGVLAFEASLQNGDYLTDLDALCARWGELQGSAPS